MHIIISYMFRFFLGYYQGETKYERCMELECVSSVETAASAHVKQGSKLNILYVY